MCKKTWWGLEARRSTVSGGCNFWSRENLLCTVLGLVVHPSSWWQSLIGRQTWGNLLSWVSFCYLFRLRVPVFNKMPSPVFSSLCILCQCPGNIIASDDFAVKFPSLETHCCISPEHFHLVWILVPSLEIHSVFFVVYQRKGIFFSPPRKFVSWNPSFPPLSARNQQMLNVIFHIHSDPLTVSAPFTLSSPSADSTYSRWSPPPYLASQTTPWIFYYFYSFTHFPSVSPNWLLQITARELSRYPGALFIPSSQCRTFCLFLVKISTVFTNNLLSRRPRLK